jgi:effector-binding domain-containing protein
VSAAQPQIEHRSEQPYVAIAATVTMDELGPTVDRLFPQLFGWLEARGIEPAGAPFIRYLRIDMDGDLEIELAAPISAGVDAEAPVRVDVLPSGRYVTLLYRGPYSGLVSANAALQDWAWERGIGWRMSAGSRWDGRIERYLTDPSREPDPARWETELAYLADAG